MKSRTLVAIIATIGILIVAAIGFIRPPMPSNWDEVTDGTPREKVLSMFQATIYTDMWDVKGFDQVITNFTQLGLRESVWHLTISYDESNTVENVYARFSDPNCGIYNRKVKLQ